VPRVSQEHLDARRRQILDAAAGCFARNGFHATSMTDIQAAAGLSTGGVYRHFAGKDDIIVALTSRVVDRMAERLRETADQGTPSVARLIEAMHAGTDAALMVQIWAEAGRNPEIAEIVRRHGDRLRATIRSVLAPCGSADLVEGFVALSVGVFISRTRFGVDTPADRLTCAVRELLTREAV
jgi:AcrR family transcriptional regulator